MNFVSIFFWNHEGAKDTTIHEEKCLIPNCYQAV